jgi:antitoxin (DNA-binding transcriptional repressor) of toxin-antitoxin stability system
MVKTVTALQARHNLGELLEGAFHRGDQFVIERAGKPMAAVVPLDMVPDYDRIKAGIAEGVKDVREGRIYGPYTSAKELVRSLRRNAAKVKGKAAKRR